MVKRRSLDDALTPEEEAFLAGSSSKKSADSRAPKAPRKQPRSKQKPQKEKVTMNKPAFVESPVEPAFAPQEAYAMPTLTALNTRIESRLSAALLRASMERRLARHPAHRVQDMAGEAVADWLKKHGYLK